MSKLIVSLAIALIFIFSNTNQAFCKAWLDLESGVVFTGYNNVQIPSDTGTRFSLKNDIPSHNELFYRIQAGYNFNDYHTVFCLIAPLRIEGSGKLQKNILFSGVNFTDGTDVKTKYRFDSYRLTYAYTFYKTADFKFALGLTAKIRDAEISVEDSSGNKGIRTNTGFVPLIHLTAEWNFMKDFGLLLDGDGLAAPQGRAEDFILAVNYKLNEDLKIRLGYRILEGGSDGGGSVYTFSMFHYLSIGINYQF